MFFKKNFLFIYTHILLDLLSLSSAEAYIVWGGKLNGYLMASRVRNIRTKNYQNLIIVFQVTVKNFRDVFLRQNVVFSLFKLKLTNSKFSCMIAWTTLDSVFSGQMEDRLPFLPMVLNMHSKCTDDELISQCTLERLYSKREKSEWETTFS